MSFGNLTLVADGESDQRSEYVIAELNTAFTDDVTKVTAEFPNAQSVEIDNLFKKNSDIKFISAKYQEDILIRSKEANVHRVSCAIVEQWLKYGIAIVAINGRYINIVDVSDVSIYRLRYPMKKVYNHDDSSLFVARTKINDEPILFFTRDKLVHSILRSGEVHFLSHFSPTWNYNGSIKRFESMISYSKQVLELIEAHKECAIKRDILNSNAFVIANRKSFAPKEADQGLKDVVSNNITVARQFHNSENMNVAIENTYVDAEHVRQMAPYVVGEEPRQTLRSLQRELYAHFNFPAFFGGAENRERASSSQIQVEFQIQRYFKTIKLMSLKLQEFWASIDVETEIAKPVIQPSIIKMLEKVLTLNETKEMLTTWFQGL